jgi:penicillin V acylase-like amidase (Ntn superfamily)
MKRLFAFLLLFIFSFNQLFACSAYALRKGNHLVMGKNLDWICDYGQIIVNKRNLAKTAFLPVNGEPFKWAAKYGSITFNSTGPSSPGGGMNEAGLVIEESSLNVSKYPEADDRKAVDEIQWIQYQLDVSASVDDVIASDKFLRIKSYYGNSHYFVYDKQGDALTVDALDGKIVFHKIPNGGVQVLTNNPYTVGMDKLKTYEGFGGTGPVPTSPQSLDRFCKAADMIKKYELNDTTNIVDYAFNILNTIKQQSTIWSVVYDITKREILFKTRLSPEIKVIRMKDFDFACDKPMMLLDINIKKGGDVSKNFTPYSSAANREMITKIVLDWRKKGVATQITDAELVRLGNYGETLTCGN